MFQWSEEYKCLVDEGGLPISLKRVEQIAVMVSNHKKLSHFALAGMYNDALKKQYPDMEEQFRVTADDMK